MPGLAHDELQRDFGLAEVGGGTVTQLVQVEPGVFLQQDAGAVVARRAWPVCGQMSAAAGRRAGTGRRSDTNNGRGCACCRPGGG
ncbi:hypothetical protein [Nonomuraea gerenzanensis]|uniref:hypothetical protein n=1 Tax=Nonomuraea gerenzanensis TaxID=93944 RepID=UPI001CD95CBD|nr:hypothetical protein [Nonomuraea gerenzanensis]UBU08349.1 hypothetical protein LCN96_28545 [Nonomuraea gerenzanensis]